MFIKTNSFVQIYNYIKNFHEKLEITFRFIMPISFKILKDKYFNISLQWKARKDRN